MAASVVGFGIDDQRSLPLPEPLQRPAEGVDMGRKPKLGMQQLPNIEWV
jgi:hypothetical protein